MINNITITNQRHSFLFTSGLERPKLTAARTLSNPRRALGSRILCFGHRVQIPNGEQGEEWRFEPPPSYSYTQIQIYEYLNLFVCVGAQRKESEEDERDKQQIQVSGGGVQRCNLNCESPENELNIWLGYKTCTGMPSLAGPSLVWKPARWR